MHTGTIENLNSARKTMFQIEELKALWILVALLHCASASMEINATTKKTMSINNLTDNWHADSIIPRYKSSPPSSDYYLREIVKQLTLLNKKFDRMMIRMVGSTVKHEDYDDMSLKRPEANDTQPDCESLIGTDLPSGIYYFDPSTRNDIGWVWNIYSIYCDQSAGGGWTLIQRRGEFTSGIVNFTKSWNDYAKGFGHLDGEFWLGNEWIHRLTTFVGPYELRIEFTDLHDNMEWSQYSEFKVFSKEENYQIHIGGHTGNGTNIFNDWSFSYFSTYDRKNSFTDVETSCTSPISAGWWYSSRCDPVNLNSENIKSSKMMIRLKYHSSVRAAKLGMLR